jgi:glycosyltransferase involved in cell wall biosynthesis
VKEPPHFSIIIPVYNGAQYLQRCINSVLSQDYSLKDMVIIDGGSKDNSVDIIKKNSTFINYWVSEPDKGVGDAYNKGLKKIVGNWVYFLTADDIFLDPSVLSRVAREISDIPLQIQVAYGKVNVVSADGEILQTMGRPWEKIKKAFLETNTIPHQGVFHRASLFKEYGDFDYSSFRIGADYELLLRVLKHPGAEARFLEHITVAAVQTGGWSNDIRYRPLVIKEMKRAREKNGVVHFSWTLHWLTVKTFLRLGLLKVREAAFPKPQKQSPDPYEKYPGRRVG